MSDRPTALLAGSRSPAAPTVHNATHASVRTSEARYRALVEAAQHGVWVFDRQGVTTFANPFLEQLVGCAPGAMRGCSIYDFFAPDSKEAARALARPLQGALRLDEVRLLTAQAEEVWVALVASPIRESAGGLDETMVLVTDIRDRRRAEDALRESEERWRAIAENPFDFVVMVDRAGVFRYINRANPGESIADLLGKVTLFERVDPEQHELVRTALDRVFDDGEPPYFETYSYATGEWYGNFTSPVRRGGRVVLAAMLCRNITESKRAEAALTDAKSRLEEAERVAKIGSWHWNIVRNELQWSNETYRIFGLTPQAFEATYEAFLALVVPEDRQLVQDAVSRALEDGVPYSIDHSIVTPGGAHRIVHERAEVYRDEAGLPLRMVGTVQDITERKATERELQRLHAELEERVAARTAALAAANSELESFAYSVSHDLRAPLRGINGLSHAVLEDYGAHLPDEGRDWLERIRAAAGRMGGLIDELLALAKISRMDLSRSVVDMGGAVAEIANELNRAARRDVEVLVRGPCVARVDPGLIRVALQNLLDNAWKYTGREQAPRVEFGSMDLRGERVFYVRDNGVGFDPAQADRLFGAFQRLHHPSEFDGTGIGLATVRRIVHRHGGRIWAESAPGAGATFYFTVEGRSES